jgi:hypothetical protein
MRTCFQAMAFYGQANRDYFPYDHSQSSNPGSPALPVEGGNCWEFFHKYVQKSLPGEFTNLGKCPLSQPNASSTYHAWLEWYTCPSDQYYHTSQIKKSMPGGKTSIEYMLSYCITLDIAYERDPKTSTSLYKSIRKQSSVKPASSKMLISEAGDDVVELDTLGWEKRDRNGPPDLNNQIGFQIQHRGFQGGQNMVYMDGHAQFHKALLGSSPWYGLPPPIATLFKNDLPPLALKNGVLTQVPARNQPVN